MKMNQKFNIERKKEIYRKNIRRAQIDEKLKAIREQIINNEVEQNIVSQEAEKLVEDLPKSIWKLVDLANDNFHIVSQQVIKNIDIFCQKMVDLSLLEWSYYAYLINRTLVSPITELQLKRVIKNSILSILEAGDRIIKASKNDVGIVRTILNACLQYINRLGKYIRTLDRIQLNAIIQILHKGWQFLDEEMEPRLLTIIHQILVCGYDRDQIENITSTELDELQILKHTFLLELFYRNDSVIEKMLRKLFSLISEGSNQLLLELYLRILIQMTHFLLNPVYYTSFLKHHIVLCLNQIFICPPENEDIIIYAIKLVNNLLVNEEELTLRILKQLVYFKILKMWELSDSRSLKLQVEDFLINLIHMISNDVLKIRQLIKGGADEIIFSHLRCYEQLDQKQIEQTIVVITIMFDHDPFYIKDIIRREHRLLKRIQGERCELEDIIKSILLRAFQESSLETECL